MEEEKAEAYYDELTRKGGGAARFKQSLGFSSSGPENDDVLTKQASSFMAVFSLKLVAGIEWPKNSVHSLLSSLRLVWSSAIVVLEEKALDFEPNYARFRAVADKC
ncbi:hypothetical protein Q3G72_020175 [Acer saccharum]|nr:hypothetical protein Q3G72_020175 [Acer saccharum]